MTVEQVLVYLLAATAGIFLFLGLAQALGHRPIRSRRRVGRPVDPPSTEEAHIAPAWARPGKSESSPSPEGIASDAAEVTFSGASTPTGTDSAAPGAPASVAAADPVTPAVPAVPDDPDFAVVEEAMRLCLGAKHEEVLARLEPRLISEPGAGEQGSHVTAALHSLVGLARCALGHASSAHDSFEAGGRALPVPRSAPCPPGIATLSIPVARHLLDAMPSASSRDDAGQRDGDQADGGWAGESVGAARLALFWLTWSLQTVPADEDARALLGTAREVVAESHAEAATAAIRRHAFGEARAIVGRAVESGELPHPRGEVLMELLGVTFRREIDRLTAGAVRGGNDESDAVSGLGQAEALLGSMREGALGPMHRAAVAQRIWRAHSKLGFRRLGVGQLDAAAEALFHALAMREIGRRRQRQVRDALVRTLEGLGDQQAAAVSALLAEGKHPAAAEEVARLELRVRRAREEGVSDEELEVATAKLEQVRRRLEESDTVR